MTTVAERKNATGGQVALAWLLAQKPWIVPIPGTRRLERLDENLRSAELELTPEDLAELDSASASVQVQGDRAPPQHAAASLGPAGPRRVVAGPGRFLRPVAARAAAAMLPADC